MKKVGEGCKEEASSIPPDTFQETLGSVSLHTALSMRSLLKDVGKGLGGYCSGGLMWAWREALGVMHTVSATMGTTATMSGAREDVGVS